MDGFARAFYAGTPEVGYYTDNTAGPRPGPASFGRVKQLADFWKESEMIETAEDYYDLAGDPAYSNLVAALCAGFLSRYGTDWSSIISLKTGRADAPRANDDMVWAIIAFTRARAITGSDQYATIAARNFDVLYARAHSRDFGGGLWWRSAQYRPQKNTTTNATAVMAACRLYLATRDARYLTIATQLYAWQRSHLFQPRSGAVYDSLTYSRKHTVVTDRTRLPTTRAP